MSLILEALKKAQRDRERHQAPEARLPREATLRKSRPRASWAVIAGAVLLFASGGVVTWWWGRAASPLPATPAREAGGQPAPPSIRPTPPAQPRPLGPSGTADMAGPPAASAAVRRPTAAAPSAALVPPPRESATPASVPRAPAPLATAVPVPQAEPMPAPPASPSLAEVIPTLTLNAHIYSKVKEERIVYIDNRRYVEGQRVNGLYLLEAITPQGVLLSYQGERELLFMKATPPRRP